MIFTYLYSLVEVLVVLVPILLSVAFITVIERKVIAAIQRRVGPNMVGFYGVLQPFADALKLVVKETIVPNHANRVLLFLAPIITLTFSLLGWAVMPLGQGLALADLQLGILYSIALSSVGILGILFAGWSSNSKYAFIGGIRSTSQMLSYELILTSVILIVILITGTFSYTNIIQHQQSVWFVVPLFPLFIIWFFSALAETNRTPFDLPEAFRLKYIICWKPNVIGSLYICSKTFRRVLTTFFYFTVIWVMLRTVSVLSLALVLTLQTFFSYLITDFMQLYVSQHVSFECAVIPVAVESYSYQQLKHKRNKLWKTCGIYGIKNNVTGQIY